MILLRSALFNLYFFGLTFVLTLAASAARVAGGRHVAAVGRLWARCLLAGARVICGIRVSMEGMEHIPSHGGALIASRHESAFDTFIWMTLLPRCSYVLKQELVRIPLFGPLLTAAGMIAIDRSAGGAALRALLRAGEAAAREARQIVIFPEGTRSGHGHPRPLQPGIAALAVRTGLPVIPVATDSGLCWGRRAFRKRPGTVRIVIGRPIPPHADRKVLMQAVAAGISLLDYDPDAPRRSAA
ncbi:MAG TPA: lysophospholipid acyltransferase family protein [Rhodopila sp.]|nr:lysophospholipid acyltransferase family protein [Rhodopila sp.]